MFISQWVTAVSLSPLSKAMKTERLPLSFSQQCIHTNSQLHHIRSQSLVPRQNNDQNCIMKGKKSRECFTSLQWGKRTNDNPTPLKINTLDTQIELLSYINLADRVGAARHLIPCMPSHSVFNPIGHFCHYYRQHGASHASSIGVIQPLQRCSTPTLQQEKPPHASQLRKHHSPYFPVLYSN